MYGQLKIRLLVPLAALFYCGSVYAQDIKEIQDHIVPDTLVQNETIQRYRKFYDDLESASENSRFMRWIYRAVVTDDRRSELPTDTRLRDELEYFTQYEGKKVRDIFIYRNNIFDEKDEEKRVYRFLNGIHSVTNEKQISRNLLFKSGDGINPQLMVQNERLLRDLPFLSSASIILFPDNEDPDIVDIFIVTRDKWSIGAEFRTALQEGYYLRIYDENFLGSGKQLGVRTYVNYKKPLYGGNMFEYSMSNMFGSFFDSEFYAGKGYEERNYSAQVKKDFIISTDYMAGGIASWKRYYDFQLLTDTVNLIKATDYQLWGGKSFNIKALKSSVFLTGGYRNVNYKERPEVVADSNTYYHSNQTLLFGVGLYRESFYQGNMIYGYGTTEDIPYGFKLEFNIGRYWGEFDNRWYGLASFTTGRQSRIGYLRGEITGTTFITNGGRLRQGALYMDLKWFSNLFYMKRSYLRQFIDIRYSRGYGRDRGEGERLTFYDVDGPEGYRGSERMTGNNRLVLNTETVVFSPLYFYGFRFAFFAFADIAWIGDKSFVYQNDFYSTLGVGVRIKNERLVFKTIQLRLGLAINNNGFPKYTHLRYTSLSTLEGLRFRPENPQIKPYR